MEATELADLLIGKGIPICLLNACQSGKQVQQTRQPSAAPEPAGTGAPPSEPPPIPLDRETSLGSRLMMAGLQMVVAMGYSVTVSAARILMETLYTQVFAHQSLTEALRLGRRELFNRKERRAYHNLTIALEDWLLPVVYTHQPVALQLQDFQDPRDAEAFYEALGRRYRFVEPTYGFVGRDLEILKIEKALLRHNVLLLRGMGGTGKTTLLNYSGVQVH